MFYPKEALSHWPLLQAKQHADLAYNSSYPYLLFNIYVSVLYLSEGDLWL